MTNIERHTCESITDGVKCENRAIHTDGRTWICHECGQKILTGEHTVTLPRTWILWHEGSKQFKATRKMGEKAYIGYLEDIINDQG